MLDICILLNSFNHYAMISSPFKVAELDSVILTITKSPT